ncbi:L-amino acid N-acyltransferase YncA [Lentzea albidocapillata subsp. violacea]|uniref:L-amino acid N-acyltransferase YncA n=1 Tax=Lentzea albidocapillata subsp. violacea TaxID=128104 RepID=A0A1G9LRX1_9PSEU|nr:GNAT family N-acetyltransferase [Lentzea albidocapillata]SDL64653.1 L-amino acid N-acyltransferase YncA [Lentzea albidocapillata subsp. violacea]
MANMEIRELDGDDAGTIGALLPGFRETMRVELPDDPPVSPALLGRLLQRRRGTDRVVLAAFDGDVPAGYVKLGLDLGATLDTGHGSLWVFPGHRRAGVGGLLVEASRRALAERGRAVLLVDAPHTEAADRFAESLRGKRIRTNVRSRFVFAAAGQRLPGLAGQTLPGYRLVHWHDHCPDDLAESYARAWSLLDVPINGQAAAGDMTVAGVRAVEAEALRSDHRVHAVAAVREADGEVAGYSTVFVRESPMADAGVTHVLAPHRRRRIGTVLKASLLHRISVEQPHVRLVQAWHDETSEPILRLSRDVGFVPSGSWSTYEFAA